MNLVLNYEDYEPYFVERNEMMGGIQYLFKFENQYGASVIKHKGSYGYEQDLWELAVIKYNDCGQWHLDFKTDITSDVEGYLTNEDVIDLLKQIKEL